VKDWTTAKGTSLKTWRDLITVAVALLLLALPLSHSMGAEYTAAQMEAAHDLLIAGSLHTVQPDIRTCPPLPKDANTIRHLEYDPDDSLITFNGPTHGLKTLPAGLLRFAFCIPTPPDVSDKAARALWLKGFSNYQYRSVQILSPQKYLPERFLLDNSLGQGARP
jgi:hypothetical protein